MQTDDKDKDDESFLHSFKNLYSGPSR